MGAIAGALAAMGVVLLFVWYCYLARPKVEAFYAQYDFEDLQRKYNWLTVVDMVLAPIIVIGGILVGAFLGGIPVYWFVKNYVWTTSDTRLLLEFSTWLFFNVATATFLPLILGMMYMLVWWVVLGKNAKEYFAFVTMKSKLIYPVWSLVLTFVVIPAALAVLFFLTCDHFVRATDSELVVNRFWSLGAEHYRYDEITTIEHWSEMMRREKQINEAPHYRLTFANGGVWESQGIIKEEGPYAVAKQRAFFEFISQKCGKPIIELPSRPPRTQ